MQIEAFDVFDLISEYFFTYKSVLINSQYQMWLFYVWLHRCRFFMEVLIIQFGSKVSIGRKHLDIRLKALKIFLSSIIFCR